MARFRRKARRSFGRSARRHTRRSGSGISTMGLIIPALAYGAGRGYLSNLVAPLTAKIPLGNYADEVVMGGLGFLAAKKGKGLIKQVGTAMLIVEASRIGDQAVSGMVGSSSGSSQAGSNPSFGGWV